MFDVSPCATVINGERAALHSPHFEVKLQRTRKMLLNNLAKTFMKRKDIEGFAL